MSNTSLTENELVQSLLKERKSDRLWRNIRFTGWLILLITYAFLIFAPAGSPFGKTEDENPYVALVRLQGVILPGSPFSAERVMQPLTAAFADKKAKGVVLQINSPGGSAVQASIIHDKILELKKRYHKKVIVLGVDALASGAYLIATAADKIYVNKNTITGSIGVVMSGFGFVDAIEKVGVTRRVFTAGANKDRLDPFENVTTADRAKVHNVLNAVHQNFIADVKAGRGKKLKGQPKQLFSGDFWIGQQAVKLGLVDGTRNLWDVLHENFDVKHYRTYAAKTSFMKTLLQDASEALNVSVNTLTHATPVREQAY